MDISKTPCIICLQPGGSSMVLKPERQCFEMIRNFATKRAAFGESKFANLSQRINELPDQELFASSYHSSCYKDVVHSGKIKRAEKRFQERSVDGSVAPPKRGRPSSSILSSTESSSSRCRRSAGKTNLKRCVFQCGEADKGELHRVESFSMGERFMFLKENSPDENCRIALASINEPLDCVAADLFYHRNCLRNQERKSKKNEDESVHKIGQYIADIEIINELKCSLENGVVGNMNEVNQEYNKLLSEYAANTGSTDRKKYLKSLITKNIPDVEFVKAYRKNESERILSKRSLGDAVNEFEEYVDDEEDIKCLSKAAAVLRRTLSKTAKWRFEGSMNDFEVPKELSSFIKWVLIGTKSQAIGNAREVTNTVATNVIAQQIMNNYKTDRQVTYNPLVKDTKYRKRSETPLSVGLSLMVHKQTRSKKLVDTLSKLNLCIGYESTISLEKRIATGVAERMEQNGGFFLPHFIKKEKQPFFAIDNIDFLECTPDGQNTLHGTIIVVNQAEVEDGIAVNDPLAIPNKSKPIDICIANEVAPRILPPKDGPRFHKYTFDLDQTLLQRYKILDAVWFFACYAHWKMATKSLLSTDDNAHEENMEEECQSAPLQPHERGRGMPTWAATNSLLLSAKERSLPKSSKTLTGIVVPLLRSSPTDYATLYKALCITQGISAIVTGPNRKTIITLDLDLYERAVKLQQANEISNWFLRIGELHTCFASLHALGKYIEASGIDVVSIEEGIYSPATIRQILGGKNYKRGVEYHVTNALALWEMLFDVLLHDNQNIEQIMNDCHAFRERLHSNWVGIDVFCGKIAKSLEDLGILTDDKISGAMPIFLLNYLRQVESLLRLIRASRQGDLKLYIPALQEQVKYYFAHDLYKYARLVPYHIAQLQQLKEDDVETWSSLEENFSVIRSGIPFTNLFVDQTLEQQIRGLKVAGGITGITQNESALDRYLLIAPETKRIVDEFQASHDARHRKKRMHHQLTGSMASRVQQNAAKINNGIRKHCVENPFAANAELMNIASNMAVSPIAERDIVERDKRGEEALKSFVSSRLLSTTAKMSIWDPMKKLSLKTFSNWQKKSRFTVNKKVVKLREDRQLLARFLVIQRSRPELVQKLNDVIGTYEFSTTPRALFSADGQLLIPTDKSAFVKTLESHADFENHADVETEISETTRKICIIDAMAVVQTIKKGTKMTTCADFAQAFVSVIRKILHEYDEGRVIFDRYIEHSLKSQTRAKRTSGKDPVKFQVNDTTNIKNVPLKTFLSHIETKAQLTEYLGKVLLQAYQESQLALIIVYGTCTYSNRPAVFDESILHHNHEEADTIIPLHVLDAFRLSPGCKIDVRSPDTDVFILLMDLCARRHDTGIVNFITGQGKFNRSIDVKIVSTVVGQEKSKALIGLHAISGADWGGKFFGISKQKWINAFLKHSADDDIVHALQSLGEEDFELESNLVGIQKLVCLVYSPATKATKVNVLRWELFSKRNMEAEKLPPTLGALIPHIKRANLIARISKGYRNAINIIPPLAENGWEIAHDILEPQKCLELPAPQAVLELVKCGCKGRCQGRSNCSCLKNDMPCTELCKCEDCENVRDYTADVEIDDDSEEDEEIDT